MDVDRPKLTTWMAVQDQAGWPESEQQCVFLVDPVEMFLEWQRLISKCRKKLDKSNGTEWLPEWEVIDRRGEECLDLWGAKSTARIGVTLEG